MCQLWEFVIVRDEERQKALAEIVKTETAYKGTADPELPANGNHGEFINTPVTMVVAGDTHYER